MLVSSVNADTQRLSDTKEAGIGLDLHGGIGDYLFGARSMNVTPISADVGALSGDKSRISRPRASIKRPHGNDDDDDESEPDGETRPVDQSNGSAKKSSLNNDMEMEDALGVGAENEIDSKVYCTCRQVSYGEMIGCDDDDCEIEWVRVVLQKKKKGEITLITLLIVPLGVSEPR